MNRGHVRSGADRRSHYKTRWIFERRSGFDRRAKVA